MEKNTEQFINKYCGQIEERIAACRDKKVAECLKQIIFLEIKHRTKDDALLKNIETHIDNLIDARFSSEAKKGHDMKRFEKNIPIEELIAKHPFSVHYLMKKGIKCIVCGEPIWGTLEDAAKEKGFSNQDVDRIVQELNELIEN
ncbi:MAG: DUF1858 domain-containing protein [bacterium]|jgi:hypothetical protein|nr:DUF1858 domain-containing protein [bacterium]